MLNKKIIPKCNETLLVNLKNLVRKEKEITTEILEYLEAVESRRLHIQWGYSSLFSFCVGELKYSESSAQRRISSMLLSKELPMIKTEFENGSLNLPTVSQLQGAITKQERATSTKISLEEKAQLVESIKDLSQKQVEQTIAKTFPDLLPTENTKVVTKTHHQLKLVVSQECFEKLNQLKDLLSHCMDQPTFSSLLEHMTDQLFTAQMKKKGLTVETHEDTKNLNDENEITDSATGDNCNKLVSKRTSAADVKGQIRTATKGNIPTTAKGDVSMTETKRDIPTATRKFIWRRDQGKCQYVDFQTGKKCGSTHRIQIDHQFPFAVGGTHEPENLRLMCKTHNLWLSERFFKEAW